MFRERDRDLFAEGIEDSATVPDAYVPPAAFRKIVERRTEKSAG